MKKIPLAILVVLLVPLGLWWSLRDDGGGGSAVAAFDDAAGAPEEASLRPASSPSKMVESAPLPEAEIEEAVEGAEVSTRAELPLLHGRVVDAASGRPVTGSRVYRREGSIRRFLAAVDDQGRFACLLDMPEEEPLVLNVRTPHGWERSAVGSIVNARQRTGEEEVVLQVRREPGRLLELVVLDQASKERLEGVKLGYHAAGAPSTIWATSDAAGRIRSEEEVPFGRVRVVAREREWVKVADSRQVHRESATAPLKVAVFRGPVFPVAITAPFPNPVSRVTLAVRTAEIPLTSEATTSVEGRVVRGDPDRVEFPLSAPEASVLIEGTVEEGGWIGVVAAHSRADHDVPMLVAMQRSGGISGSVDAPGLESLAGVRIMLLARAPPNENPEPFSPYRLDVPALRSIGIRFRLASDVVVTDDEGRWEISNRRPGEYVLWAVADQVGHEAQQVVMIESGKTTSVRLALADPTPPLAGTLSGRISCASRSGGSSEPLNGARVREDGEVLVYRRARNGPRVTLRRVTPFVDDADVWRHRSWITQSVPYAADMEGAATEFEFGPLPDAAYKLALDHLYCQVSDSMELTARPPASDLLLECHGAWTFVDLRLAVVDAGTGEGIERGVSFRFRTGDGPTADFVSLLESFVVERGAEWRLRSVLDDPALEIVVDAQGYESGTLLLEDCPLEDGARTGILRLRRKQ